MTWQRRARLVVGLFLVAFSAIVYFAIRTRDVPARAGAPAERLDLAAASETSSGVWTFANGETAAFARLLAYGDGRLKAFTVTLRLPEEDGGLVTITAQEAEQREAKLRDALGTVDLSGDVDITTDDGLHVTTDAASYTGTDRTVRAPGLVHFERGRMTGSGVGAIYDRDRDRLWLLNEVRVAFSPDAAGRGALDVTAGAAGLARDEHRVHFERGVHIERADRIIDTLDAVVWLSEDDTRVTLVELRGDARVTRPGAVPAQPGDLASMQSRDMDLTYGEDGTTLERATLVGTARLDLVGGRDAASRRIAAERLDLQVAPDGTTVTSLTGRERVEFALPAAASAPAQRVTAAALDASGDAGGLRTARFTGGVEYRETPIAKPGAAKPAERVARAARLDLALKAGFDAIDAAEFAGDVTFTDGVWRGEGPRARYAPASGALSLTADAASPALPRVADDRVTIDARAIDLTLETTRLEARQSVQSVIRARRATETTDTKLPALLAAEEAVYVTSGRLVYDGEAALATYSGGARLWQGETVIQADTITIDSARGNLSADGQVRSVLTLADPGSEGAPARTIAEGGRLEYDEAERRATYLEDAHLNGPEGDVRAARIVLHLAASGGELSRADAFDGVSALLERVYTVTGTQLSYLAAEGRYVVNGAPVRIIERKPTECLETTGTILTFLRSTATIDIVGTGGNRSQTRPVPCPERRR